MKKPNTRIVFICPECKWQSPGGYPVGIDHRCPWDNKKMNQITVKIRRD